jgi:hypothetical protein
MQSATLVFDPFSFQLLACRLANNCPLPGSIRLLVIVSLFVSLAMCSASFNALPSVAVAACSPQADAAEDTNQDAGRGPFRRYFFRGLEVPQLLDLSQTELLKLLHARARRVFSRGMSPAHVNLIKRLRKAKKAAGADGKPETIKVCFIFHSRTRVVPS